MELFYLLYTICIPFNLIPLPLFLSLSYTHRHTHTLRNMCILTTVTFWWMLFFPSPNFLRRELLLVIVKAKPFAPLRKESIFVTLI